MRCIVTVCYSAYWITVPFLNFKICATAVTDSLKATYLGLPASDDHIIIDLTYLSSRSPPF